jgi:hypothetical protein
MVVPVTEEVTVEVEMVDIELRPNHAFNADPSRRAFGPGRWGRLTWFR